MIGAVAGVRVKVEVSPGSVLIPKAMTIAAGDEQVEDAQHTLSRAKLLLGARERHAGRDGGGHEPHPFANTSEPVVRSARMR